MSSTGQSKRLPGAIALLALILAGVAALLIAGAGPAYRTGLLSLGASFETLRYGVIAATAAGVVGLAALTVGVWRRDRRPALTGGVVVIATIAVTIVPLLHWQQAQTVPPINDITTDTRDPPAFKALAAAREEAPNALAYPGEDTARQQRNAYPDIGPLSVEASLPVVLKAAKAEVDDFGWELVAATGNSIEATATTTWFGFQDDVVIRLQAQPNGVRVDMRSASRVGRSDVGANAARTRAYLDALEQRLNPSSDP